MNKTKKAVPVPIPDEIEDIPEEATVIEVPYNGPIEFTEPEEYEPEIIEPKPI